MQEASDHVLVDRELNLLRGTVHVRITLEVVEAEQEAWVRLAIEDDAGELAEAAIVFWSFTSDRCHRGPAFTTTLSSPGTGETDAPVALTERAILGLSVLLGQVLHCWYEDPPRTPTELAALIRTHASRLDAVTAAVASL